FSSGHATSRTLSGSQSWYQKTFATHRLTQSESVERDVRGVSTEQCQNDVVPHGAPRVWSRDQGTPPKDRGWLTPLSLDPYAGRAQDDIAGGNSNGHEEQGEPVDRTRGICRPGLPPGDPGGP